jgi:hypothetical protein
MSVDASAVAGERSSRFGFVEFVSLVCLPASAAGAVEEVHIGMSQVENNRGGAVRGRHRREQGWLRFQADFGVGPARGGRKTRRGFAPSRILGMRAGL